MSIINFSNTRQMEGILNEISQVKELIESKINLSRTVDREKRASLTTNKVMRICFIVGFLKIHVIKIATRMWRCRFFATT